jgi:hypothetical protein
VRVPLGVLVLVRAPLRSITKNILSIFLVTIVLSNNYDSPRGHKHPNVRWSPRLASLQKLVLQVCKSWERVVRRLRDKLLRKTWSVMFYEGSIRHHQDHIQVLLQCFSDTIKTLLKVLFS